MKWIICLSGDEDDLYEISKSLNTEGLTVFKEENQYYLKSSEIMSTDEYREVSEKAKRLVDLINGATKLALGTRNTIAVSDIYFLNDDGGRTFFMTADFSSSIRVRASYQIIKADGTVEICNPADSVPNWLELSRKNELINKVIKLISHDSESWVGLFKIFEVIDKDAGVKSFSSVSTENIKRFTQTANSYKAVGMDARHALDYEPPKRPMNISEAKSLIYLIVNEWLREKEKI